MNDTEIIVIFILFHFSDFCCFKYYYKEYLFKRLKYFFLRLIFYDHFAELEKEVLFPLTVFTKKVLLSICAGISK